MLTLLGPGGAGEAKVAEPHLPDMALFQVHTREIGEKDAENSIPQDLQRNNGVTCRDASETMADREILVVKKMQVDVDSPNRSREQRLRRRWRSKAMAEEKRTGGGRRARSHGERCPACGGGEDGLTRTCWLQTSVADATAKVEVARAAAATVSPTPIVRDEERRDS